MHITQLYAVHQTAIDFAIFMPIIFLLVFTSLVDENSIHIYPTAATLIMDTSLLNHIFWCYSLLVQFSDKIVSCTNYPHQNILTILCSTLYLWHPVMLYLLVVNLYKYIVAFYYSSHGLNLFLHQYKYILFGCIMSKYCIHIAIFCAHLPCYCASSVIALLSTDCGTFLPMCHFLAAGIMHTTQQHLCTISEHYSLQIQSGEIVLAYTNTHKIDLAILYICLWYILSWFTAVFKPV
jgi:hypothetical protein